MKTGPAIALTEKDEGRHDKTPDKYWRESYYFNFADDKAGVYGFTTIGWRVNEKEVDGLLMVIRNRKLFYAYPAVNRGFDRPWDSFELPENARVGRLHYDMASPFKKWRLVLDGGRGSMELDFDCFTPVYDYHAETSSLPANVAARHYEQSGFVRGDLRLRGKSIAINGAGQRDHSWGIRDWGGVENWRWLTAQFGSRFSFNVFSVNDGGGEKFGGFVFDGRDNLPVAESRIHLDFMPDGNTPRGAEVELVDKAGGRHRISAVVFHAIPLKRHGAFIKECFARFYYRGMEGCGVIERLHRIKSRSEKIGYIGAAAAYGLRSVFGATPLYPKG